MTMHVSGVRGLRGWRRLLVLALCSLGCGLLGALTLLVTWFAFDPDGAEAWHSLDSLASFAVVLLFVSGLVVPVSALGTLFAWFLLRDTRLWPSIGVVTGCVVGTSAVLAWLGLCAVPVAFGAGCLAMVACADRFPERRVKRLRPALPEGTRPAGGVSDGPR